MSNIESVKLATNLGFRKSDKVPAIYLEEKKYRSKSNLLAMYSSFCNLVCVAMLARDVNKYVPDRGYTSARTTCK